MKFLGGMYAVCLPGNEYAVLYPGSHIESHLGMIPLPDPGFDILEFEITVADGEFKIAGKAQREPNSPDRGVWEWRQSTSEWTHLSTDARGTYPVIYDHAGVLHHATQAQNGSQGWRYVAENGALVTGDDTLNEQRAVGIMLGLDEMWEYSHFAGVTIGQGVELYPDGREEAGARVIIDGVRRNLLDGDTNFIRVHYRAGMWAVGLTRLHQRDAYAYWLTRPQLSQLAAIAPIDVTVPPVDVIDIPPSPEPEPVDMPESLIESVRAERAKYGATLTPEQMGQLLNAVAWKHRADGWGLSEKPSGNHVPSPQGKFVAYDILHHKPTDTLWDVATGESAYEVKWGQAEHHNNKDRPWLAPVQPSGAAQPSEPGGTVPSSGSIDALVRAMVAQAVAPLQAEIAAIKKAVAERPSTAPAEFPRRIALRAHTGKLLCVEQGSEQIVVNRQDAGGWETFDVEPQ
jgi:hypothetical protein